MKITLLLCLGLALPGTPKAQLDECKEDYSKNLAVSFNNSTGVVSVGECSFKTEKLDPNLKKLSTNTQKDIWRRIASREEMRDKLFEGSSGIFEYLIYIGDMKAFAAAIDEHPKPARFIGNKEFQALTNSLGQYDAGFPKVAKSRAAYFRILSGLATVYTDDNALYDGSFIVDLLITACTTTHYKPDDLGALTDSQLRIIFEPPERSKVQNIDYMAGLGVYNEECISTIKSGFLATD